MLFRSDVAIIGVPFDQGTFGRPGARFGPDAIRDAPRGYNYSDPYGAQIPAEGLFDIDIEDELLRGVTMADCGNITVVPSEVVENFGKLTAVVEKVVERGSFPVVVGGDHAITFPVVRGLGKFSPLNIVHFDAHLDYTHDVQGVLYTHGSPIRRCRELPFVDHITSAGIRAARRKPYEEAKQDGTLIITTNRFRELGPKGVAELIPQGENLYITFDIDVMDPSQAPGTGTPETGGLFYHEARECLTALVTRSNLVKNRWARKRVTNGLLETMGLITTTSARCTARYQEITATPEATPASATYLKDNNDWSMPRSSGLLGRMMPLWTALAPTSGDNTTRPISMLKAVIISGES